MKAPTSIGGLVAALAGALRARRWRMATAESCTGGLIAGFCTELPGSSDWFEGGVVSYSNAAKHELLGVPAAALASHGAVSEPVARAMAAARAGTSAAGTSRPSPASPGPVVAARASRSAQCGLHSRGGTAAAAC